MNLDQLGFTPFFQEAFAASAAQGRVPARVVRSYAGAVDVALGSGDVVSAVVPRGRPPMVVGDWVAVGESPWVVRELLPRRTAFVRQAAGRRAEPQVVASNVDLVFVLMGLDGDFNLRRLERYLTVALSSGAPPIVFLTKAALCREIDERVADVRGVTDVNVHPIDVLSGIGADLPASYVTEGVTAALVGSSGVGKSTLLNHVLGDDAMRTAAVRQSDDRGRHTTTHRELFSVPGGGSIVDTPGMRELQLWGEPEALDDAFADLAALISACRFANCGHGREPECAVQRAITEGALTSERLESYRRLKSELERHALRQRDGDRTTRAKKGGRVAKDAQRRKSGGD